MLDGYTTTNHYPYSQSINPTVPPGSGLDTDFNYVRNSVKATVDAYDGTIHFYVVDPTDPIIRTYRKAFPDLFDDVEGHAGGPAGALALPRRHLRRADRAVHAVPHDRPAAVLPEGGAVGHRAEPGRDRHATTAADGAGAGGNNGGRNTTLASSGNPIDPLYLMMQLPGETRPAVRARATVRAAPKGEPALVVHGRAATTATNYGKLIAVPGARSVARAVAGARRVAHRGRPEHQQDLLAARPAGSKVVRGAAQLVPIDNSIFYVRPIYVEGTGTQPLPRCNFVAVTYGEQRRARHERHRRGEQPARRHDPDGRAATILDRRQQRARRPTDHDHHDPDDDADLDAGSRPATRRSRSCSREANQLFAQANQALADQDLATFAADIQAGRRRSSTQATTLGPQASTTTPDRRPRPDLDAHLDHDAGQTSADDHHHGAAPERPEPGPGARDCRGVRGLLLSR